MKCHSCGKDIQSDFLMCPYCGAQIPTPEPEIEPVPEETIIPATEGYNQTDSFDDDNETYNDADESMQAYEDSMDDDDNDNDDDDEDEYYEIPLKKIIIVAIIVIVLAAAGYGAFRFLSQPLSAVTETIEAGSEIDPLTLVALKESAMDDYSVSVENSELDVTKPGSYTITYLLTKDNGKTKSVSFEFSVVDTIAPVITAEQTVTVPLNSDFNVLNYVNAVDGVDGILGEDQLQIDGTVDTATAGTYPITITAADSQGNQATFTLNAIVEDMGNTDEFFEKLLGTWHNEDSGLVIQFSNSSGNKIDIGMYQSEGFGTGHVRFDMVNAALTEGVMQWDYTSYYIDDNGTTVYEEVETVTVVVDTGVSGDNKITVDLGFGDGDQEFKFLYE